MNGRVATDLPQPAGPLSLAFCRRVGVLVAGESAEAVDVLCRPDASVLALSEVRRHFGRPIRITRLEADAFDARLRAGFEEGSAQTIQDIQELDQNWDLQEVAQELAEPRDLLESADDAPIIRLMNALLTEAVKRRASDIHLEPYEDLVVVRFRVDGVLHKVLEPKKALAPMISSRIKVMARLDIAEKRLPQDGRISLRIAGRPVDVRVSTIPTGHGERVVMRLLDKQAGLLGLEQLGMRPDSVAVMDRMIAKPNGVILVTGPTGSGKTTSLYAMLQRLNDHSRNIMTVEDPIEYELEGVSQTHVNTKVDLTFARGLRAILRQDPDVVMVGEVRDLETARIAVQASLTGHLVLSTLHTNSAIGALTRLRDMGVESYLLASSLVGVVSQRLVRLLCAHCRIERAPDARELAQLGATANDVERVFEPAGCDQCDGTGFSGRSGIYELLVMDETLAAKVHEGAGEQELTAIVRRNYDSLRADGLRLVKAGRTSLGEITRVTRED